MIEECTTDWRLLDTCAAVARLLPQRELQWLQVQLGTCQLQVLLKALMPAGGISSSSACHSLRLHMLHCNCWHSSAEQLPPPQGAAAWPLYATTTLRQQQQQHHVLLLLLFWPMCTCYVG
jgi:hypothetical protein